jgi:hypothetical protein
MRRKPARNCRKRRARQRLIAQVVERLQRKLRNQRLMLQTTAKKSTAVPSREELLRRAEALVPVLEQRAAQCEALRRCPDETIGDYLANDLLRICQPARYAASSTITMCSGRSGRR